MRFRQEHLEAIADALGGTDEGLKNSEIDFLLQSAKLRNPGPVRSDRIYNAFVEYKNREQSNLHILAFIRKALKPSRFVRLPERYEPMRANVNRALAFTGLLCQRVWEARQGRKGDHAAGSRAPGLGTEEGPCIPRHPPRRAGFLPGGARAC